MLSLCSYTRYNIIKQLKPASHFLNGDALIITMLRVVLFRRSGVRIKAIRINPQRTVALLFVISTGYPWQYQSTGKIVCDYFVEGAIQISIGRRKISHTKLFVQWFYGD